MTKIGRPQSIPDEAIMAIIEELEGNYEISPYEICARDDTLCYATFKRRIDSNEELGRAYARALKEQAHRMVQEILRLNKELNNENWQPHRERINNLKWLAGKRNFEYSDKPQTIIDQSKHVHIEDKQLKSAQEQRALALLAAKSRSEEMQVIEAEVVSDSDDYADLL